MKNSLANSSRGQLKIQQMAFVLVAFMILLGLVAVFFVSIRTSTLRSDAGTIKQENAQELVRKLSGTPEFAWTGDDCASCVDFDKVMALRNRTSYQNFWGNSISLVQVKRIYPLFGNEDDECTLGNYPNCGKVTLIDRKKSYTSQDAFVALCHFEPQGAYTKCELGKIVLGVTGE